MSVVLSEFKSNFLKRVYDLWLTIHVCNVVVVVENSVRMTSNICGWTENFVGNFGVLSPNNASKKI